MAKSANPDVVEASTPEMSTSPELAYEDPYEPETTAPEPIEEPGEEQEPSLPEPQGPSAAGEDETTSRRSRRQRAADRGEREPKSAKDLDQDPDFQAFKAKKDREVAEARQQAAELQRQWQEQQAAMAQQRAQSLQARLQDTDDDTERQAIIEQLGALKGATYFDQWRAWNDHMQKRIQEEGFEPTDPRFRKQYQGQEGALQFERDLLAASRDKLAKENAELKKAASPQSIERLVREQVARALQGQGLNAADLGGPGEPQDSDDAFDRDAAALQAGRLTPEKFAQKWGR